MMTLRNMYYKIVVWQQEIKQNNEQCLLSSFLTYYVWIDNRNDYSILRKKVNKAKLKFQLDRF